MLYLIILIVGAIAMLLGPWWSVALVAFLACSFKAKSGGNAFKIALAAGSSLWVAYALILMYSGRENLVDKVASIFTADIEALNSISGVTLVLFLIILISGLTTGFAGLAGYQIGSLFKTAKKAGADLA